MHVEPRSEHQWLQQLVGEWTYESQCVMGPDQPSQKFAGTQINRSIGGWWLVSEGQGDAPDGGTTTAIITLGFDPGKNRYVGTFIASMMAELWIYEGRRDVSGNVLTLDTEGPSFAGDGKTTQYQDIIEIHSADH